MQRLVLNVPGGKLSQLAGASSPFAEPFLGAFAWVMLAGPNAGLLNVLWRSWTGADGPLVNIFTMTGLVFVVTIYMGLPQWGSLLLLSQFVFGIAASGTTPYVHGALRRAKERGAHTVADLARGLDQLAVVGRRVVHGEQLDRLPGVRVELLPGVLVDLDLVPVLESQHHVRVLRAQLRRVLGWNRPPHRHDDVLDPLLAQPLDLGDHLQPGFGQGPQLGSQRHRGAVVAATSIGVTASTPEYRAMPAPFATAELRVH